VLEQSGGIVPGFVEGRNIHSGFIDNGDKVCCYSDHEIFDRFHRVSIRRSVDKTEQLTINDLTAFNIGDYVVHIDHGVGIFGGLLRMKDEMGRMKEVVKLTYKDGDVVLVSVHALNKISRFRPAEGEIPKINKLGSKTWQTLKNSAKSRIKDIAKDLIQLYAKRKASKGYAFSPDTYLQEELESSFMYEDTPDQESATRAVKHDMEEPSPMDRLVCGDVGFGKTEIAIRAAFKAVADGKQVVVLVPTTILALQHFNTFSSRLKDFPCSVDYVSRLRTAKEVAAIKESWYTVKSIPADVTPERLVEIFCAAIKEKNYDLYCDCIQPERRENEIQQDLLLYFWDLHQERFHGEYVHAEVKAEETRISVVKGYDNSSTNLDSYFLSPEDQKKIASHYGEKVEYASVQTVAFDANGKQLGSPVRRNLIRTGDGRWYIRDYEMRF
jgi:hypothetical protein